MSNTKQTAQFLMQKPIKVLIIVENVNYCMSKMYKTESSIFEHGNIDSLSERKN